MLSPDQITFYRDNGYLVLKAHLPDDVVAAAREEIARLCAHARELDESDELLDLEASHTRAEPRVRRIKRPDLQSRFFNELMRSEPILAPVRDLIGPNIRLHTAKLNMKTAEFGAPVQWHQDFAFYPHTNDDVLAVGVVFDDVDAGNGPLQVLPGSHKGPLLDHHSGGVFAGAVDLEASGLDVSGALALTGPTGTVTVHHARLLHGSATNRSGRDRRMLFYEMMAADAFPIMGSLTSFESIEEYDSRILCGAPTLEPRLADIPIRIPRPMPPKSGSIYEVQTFARAKGFKPYDS